MQIHREDTLVIAHDSLEPAKGQITFAMLKPDGFRHNLSRPIMDMAYQVGLRHYMSRVIRMTEADVLFLYGHVKERYPEVWPKLLQFSLSGPVELIVLHRPEGDAVATWRSLMGCTKSCDAQAGTIRALWGDKQVTHANVVHGSDSDERAIEEIRHFMIDPLRDQKWNPEAPQNWVRIQNLVDTQ